MKCIEGTFFEKVAYLYANLFKLILLASMLTNYSMAQGKVSGNWVKWVKM